MKMMFDSWLRPRTLRTLEFRKLHSKVAGAGEKKYIEGKEEKAIDSREDSPGIS